MALSLALLIGILAGLRSLTAPAVTAWAAYLGWLRLARPYSLMGELPSVIIFSVLAVGELVADKLPKTPSRTAPVGLIARIVMGGISGACVAAAGGQVALLAALLGSLGGIVGCFAGYFARTRIVKALAIPDSYVAGFEDVIAIAGCVWVVTRF